MSKIDSQALLSMNVTMIVGSLFFLSLVSMNDSIIIPNSQEESLSIQMAQLKLIKTIVNWTFTVIIPFVISSIILIYSNNIQLPKIFSVIGLILLSLMLMTHVVGYNKDVELDAPRGM